MDKLFLSKRMFIDSEFVSGGILVAPNGKIRSILRSQQEINSWMYANESDETFDFGDYVLMPGLIDSHVHINEPGRKEWEGFETATKAAAAGGFTTIVDMPLNSIPPTTTVENLKIKRDVARGKVFVDVAFWGGVIPGNENELCAMVDQGVVGFKCFLCPSGVPEFPNVNADQVEIALQKLQNTDAVLAFHAEICPTTEIQVDETQSKKYETYLKTRPPSMEVDAIKLVTDLSVKYDVRTHIVHLSTADALPLIRKCREKRCRLTVETCHHYLNISAEEVPDASTEYKCAPPIRDHNNQKKLWQALIDGDINLVVSDHSPSTPGVKMLTYGKNRGDFLKAWGGISSVQFGLSLFWTQCKNYGMGLSDVVRLMCTAPAELCGINDFKGKIAEGYDADFCVWDPDDGFTVTQDIVQFQNKANPYMGRKLNGLVHATIVRGSHVFQDGENFRQPMGNLIERPVTGRKRV
ncbi:allantoinase [Bradysia coprophila]|uniref:allantoinase n=1 Tax=Bradysia coprophila TaxID=38358 RepID=UPI00187D967F|nr:allantoinase [Bradysia coprophila]